MSIAAAPTIWTLPAQFDVLDLISYVRRSSILLHHQSKTGGTLPTAGLSVMALRSFPEENGAQLLSRIWDLIGAPESFYLDLVTAPDLPAQLKLLAAAMRGDGLSWRGADILILVGRSKADTGRSGGPEHLNLAQLLAHSDADVMLQDRLRKRTWKSLVGDVRIILASEPKPQSINVRISLEAHAILWGAAIFHNAFTATQVVRVLPDGLANEVSEVEGYLEQDLQRSGLVAYRSGRWVLTLRGKLVARQSAFGNPGNIHHHLAAGATFAPRQETNDRVAAMP